MHCKIEHCDREVTQYKDLCNKHYLRAYRDRKRLDKDAWSAETRRANLWRHYKITPAQYDQQLEKQGGKCAICASTKPGGRFNTFIVDHDHDTNVVRGLLCNECNMGIGKLGDNPVRVAAAARYLAFGGAN